MKKLVLLVLAFIVVLASCKKNTNSPTVAEDQLTEDELTSIENAGVDSVSTFSDLVFPDGSSIADWDRAMDSGHVYTLGTGSSSLSATDRKKLFIDRMTQAGFLLTRHTPRIAYVFGAKDFKKASTYSGAVCKEPLHGLDCAGMIYQMALASDLKLPSGGTVNYIDPAEWNMAFDNSPAFAGLQMKDLSTLPADQCLPGDIIVSAGHHIGMVVNNGSSLGVLNSVGKPSNSCLRNSNDTHGPVVSKNFAGWLQAFFTSPYHVLRITAQHKLLSKVINRIAGDPGYGETIVQLSYDGERLVMANSQFRSAQYNNGLFQQTHYFTYDAGVLTGSRVSYTDPAGFNPASVSSSRVLSTDVSYTGGEISTINTYVAGSGIYGIYRYFYQNGILDKIDGYGYTTDIVVDRNGNCQYTGTGNHYDSRVSIVSTLPYWQYFYSQQIFNTSTNNPSRLGVVNGIFTVLPNVNNELSNSNETYSYVYNADGLPSSSTVTYSGITQTYDYEYIMP